MRRITFFLVLGLLCSLKSMAQFGVSFHQSNLPFVGVNYEIKGKYMAEARVSVDTFFDDTSPEIVITRFFKRESDYQLYAGLGVRVNRYEGLVIPVGLNVYPFEKKNFGFHVEVAPILAFSDLDVLRGSYGIRYRFPSKKDK